MKNKDSKLFSALEQAWQMFSGQNKKMGKQAAPRETINNNYEQMLNTLIQNTFAQTAYIPQAKQYLQSLPVDAYQRPTNYSPANPILPRDSAGVYWGRSRGGNIILDANLLQSGNPNAIEVLRHEFNHALDTRANNPNPRASYVPQGPNTVNSNNFYPTLQQKAVPEDKYWISHFLRGYPGANINTKNKESFAQYGTIGQQTLQTPMSSYYKNMYIPASQAPLNYSPVFQAPENR